MTEMIHAVEALIAGEGHALSPPEGRVIGRGEPVSTPRRYPRRVRLQARCATRDAPPVLHGDRYTRGAADGTPPALANRERLFFRDRLLPCLSRQYGHFQWTMSGLSIPCV